MAAPHLPDYGIVQGPAGMLRVCPDCEEPLRLDAGGYPLTPIAMQVDGDEVVYMPHTLDCPRRGRVAV